MRRFAATFSYSSVPDPFFLFTSALVRLHSGDGLCQGMTKGGCSGGVTPSSMSCLSEIVGTVKALSAKFYFWRIT